MQFLTKANIYRCFNVFSLWAPQIFQVQAKISKIWPAFSGSLSASYDYVEIKFSLSKLPFLQISNLIKRRSWLRFKIWNGKQSQVCNNWCLFMSNKNQTQLFPWIKNRRSYTSLSFGENWQNILLVTKIFSDQVFTKKFVLQSLFPNLVLLHQINITGLQKK